MKTWWKDRLQSNFYACVMILLFLVGIIGCLLIGEDDFTVVVRWWGVLLLFGCSGFPLVLFLFPDTKDNGWIFSKILGLGITGYLMWLAASLKWMKFSTVAALVIWLILTVLLYGINALYCKYHAEYRKKMISRMTDSHRSILMRELTFFFLLLMFVYLFGNKMVGTETEKSMDLAFMNTIARADYFPMQDMWASGTTLNYYYFGQYLFTFLSRVAFVKIGEGYCLSIATLAAMCFMMVYCIVAEVMRYRIKEIQDGKKHIPVIAGILAAIGVTFAGNMHYLVFGKIVPMVWEILQLTGDVPSYWFADSTRYIGYIPEVTGDKTISEFPAYSFLIGDLHAHVIDIIFVLTILMILFVWFSGQRKETEKSFILEAVNQPALLLIAFILGLSSMTNYWDFPIYYVVCGSVILLGNMIQYKRKGKAVLVTLSEGFWMFLVIQLVSLPFSLQFDKMITGIGICKIHSRFYQLVILWGFPVIMVVAFIIALVREKEKVKKADLFCLLLGLCAIGLILMPELIYVKDIYEDGFPRANTMFKLTYEAFILMGVVIGYIIARFLFLARSRMQWKGGIAGLLCLCLTTGYFVMASKMWLGSFQSPANYKGIDATDYYEQTMPYDYQAALWLLQNVEGQPVVLEAEGESYTDYERISVLTGFPTVLGWHTHEWLWKNSYDFMAGRQVDVKNIYTSEDANLAKQLISRYQIQYIYVGEKEYERYGNIQTGFFDTIGHVVYSDHDEENDRSILIYQID